MATINDSMERTAQQMTDKRSVEHDRIINELKKKDAQSKAQLEQLLEQYRRAVASEEYAIAQSKQYKENYENLLHRFHKDGSKEGWEINKHRR
ncbi:unnamed protein product [Rotaria sp. Silwood2]|nr:unnamed protein product [Rotaria sp. Silwood2]